MSKAQRENDLVRAQNERDPEDISDHIAPARGEFEDQGETIALREMWYHLRASGEADSRDLRSVGWQGSKNVRRNYASVSDFWRVASNWFELLPGVHPPDSDGRTWTFDADREHERPEVPADPDPLPDRYLDTALEEIDADSRTVRKMHDHLESEGSATSDELMQHKAESRHDQHAYGKWSDRAEWFRELGRPALKELHDIARPETLGGEWTFVGVDADDLEEIHPDGVDPEVLDDKLQSAPVGGRGDWKETRRETVAKMFEDVRSSGEATREHLKARVKPQEVGYSSAEAFVDEVAAPCLTTLPGIEQDGEAFAFDSDKAREMCMEAR